jgi:hypothetical protein
LGAIVRVNPSNGTTQLVSDNAICGNSVFNHPTALTLETISGTGYLTFLDPTGGPDGLGAIVRINPYNGGSQLVSDNAIGGNQVYNHPTELITEVTGSGTQYLTLLDPTGGPDGLGSIVRINEFTGGTQLVSDNAICGNSVFDHPTALTLETINGTGYLTFLDPTSGTDGNGALVRINPSNGGSQLVSNYAISIAKFLWGNDGTAYTLGTDGVLFVNGAPVKGQIQDFALTSNGAILALDANGQLWYSATGQPNSWLPSTTTGFASFTVTSSGSAIVLGQNGTLWTSSTGLPNTWNLIASDVQSFGVRSDGNLYVLHTDSYLNLYSPAGTLLHDFGVVQGFAVGNDGQVYYLQNGNLYNGASGEVVQANVVSMAQGPHGQILVNLGQDVLRQYDPATSRFTSVQGDPSRYTLRAATIQFHTNNDDKDYDTLVTVDVWDSTNVLCAHLSGLSSSSPLLYYFHENTDNGPFGLQITNASSESAVLRGSVRIRIDPNGDDTWRFNFTLTLWFGDGSSFAWHANNVTLSEGSDGPPQRIFGLSQLPAAAGTGTPGNPGDPSVPGNPGQGVLLPFVVSDLGVDAGASTATLSGTGHVIFNPDGQGGWYFGGTIYLSQTNPVQPDGSLFDVDFSGIYSFQGHVGSDGIASFYLASSGLTINATGSLDTTSARFSGSLDFMTSVAGSLITGAGVFDQG